MGRVPRVVFGSGLVLAALLSLGALTRLPFHPAADRAELRLAWRFRVPRAEHCRRPSPEELEALPVHMRQEEICENRDARYWLEVTVDGQLRHRSVVEAAGARGDRPLYVFEALPLDPGNRTIRIRFERMDIAADSAPRPPAPGSSGGRESSPPAGPGPAVPDRLVLDRRVLADARDVILVTYDPEARSLELRGVEGR